MTRDTFTAHVSALVIAHLATSGNHTEPAKAARVACDYAEALALELSARNPPQLEAGESDIDEADLDD